MRILRHYTRVPQAARGAVIAIGNFDGVHLGHVAVIHEADRVARRCGAPLAALTFEPHPRQMFHPSTVPFRLTPFRAKARRLAELGVDYMINLRFGPQMAGLLAQDFVMKVLVKGLHVRHVVTGPDFVFGKGRRGNAYVLSHMAEMEGFGFTQIGAVSRGDKPYSATEVRVLLGRGLVDEATALLGRPWEFEGRVLAGDARGRRLGFPTANLAVEGRLHPGPGIYAVRAGLAEEGRTVWYDGVASLGRRPTFGGHTTLLEVHIFDFDRDLYGERLRVAFAERIRKEERFDSPESLKAQIAADCHHARRILADPKTMGRVSDPPAA